MYSVKYYDLSHFNELQKIWNDLSGGEDMTYFQSFDWYKMLVALNVDSNNKNFKYLFGVVCEKNGKAVLIAPLWIVTKTFKKFNKKGAYFFGRKQWSDYLNFIYKNVNIEILNVLFRSLKDNYKVNKIYFEELPTDSRLYKIVTSHFSYIDNKTTTCVHLYLPNSVDDYNKALAKNFRQNIRTAFNRTKNDCIEFVFNFDDKNVNIDKFLKDRVDRLSEKKSQWTPSRYLRFKWLVKEILTGNYWGEEYNFPEYIPITHDKNSKTMTCCTLSGDLCAAFNYGIDINKKKIVLMAVCTNSKYYRYSPGIQLIYKYILDQITKSEVKCIDFTRGTEKYKYDFGGQEHFNKSITVTI